MKRLFCFITLLMLITGMLGCSATQEEAQIAATTLPVYEFTARICQGTDINVKRLITENISCLHDYTLQTGQMRAIENAEIVITSGAGLEVFLDGVLDHANRVIDASSDIELNCIDEAYEDHHDHDHSVDPHIWLSPANAIIMAQNICSGLTEVYPQHETTFTNNLASLISDLEGLRAYADDKLENLSSREIITFHNGFSYMADAFGLHIVHAIEEESGSEASAAELIDLINIVSSHSVNTIFTECNGSDAAAKTVAAETGVKIRQLDMAMSGDSYFDAMYHNIDTLKEALK
jgi:ABC-type Zn uptake system ZnuABC Zn-binding protein ZnuA